MGLLKFIGVNIHICPECHKEMSYIPRLENFICGTCGCFSIASDEEKMHFKLKHKVERCMEL
jgi:hypothetical protein